MFLLYSSTDFSNLLTASKLKCPENVSRNDELRPPQILSSIKAMRTLGKNVTEVEENKKLIKSLKGKTRMSKGALKGVGICLANLWNSAFSLGISFPISLALHFSSFLFIKPPLITTLSSYISFSLDGFGHCLLYNVMNLCR